MKAVHAFRYFMAAAFHGSAMLSAAQWTPIATGIPGHLVAVSSTTSAGLFVAATSGLYRASVAAGPWTFLQPADPDQNVVYANTRFHDAKLMDSYGVAVGMDTVSMSAVIFRYTVSTGAVQLVYTGAEGTALNAIDATQGFIAVGDGGLVLSSNSTALTWNASTPFTTQNLNCVSSVLTYGVYIGGDSALFYNGIPRFQGRLRDVDHISTAFGVAVTDSSIHRITSGNWVTTTSYDGPLSPTSVSIFGPNNRVFLGTTNGIYYASSSTNPIYQLQPTSSGYHVNDVQGLYSGSGYAACNDGWLLVASSNGGFVEPYLNIDGPFGGCVNENILAYAPNSNVSFAWLVDGLPAGNGSSYNGWFTSAGTHQLTLVGTSGPYTDSLTIPLHISEPPPFTSVPYTVSDTLFCERGQSVVTILQTSNAYRYRLFRYDDGVMLDIALGTGGPLALQTWIQTDSCLLGIDVMNAVGNCTRRMTDTIPMHIEQTRASYLTGLLNTVPNEESHFFNTSQQAVSYEWSFSNAPSQTATTVQHPAVSFAALGQSQISLIATSAFGCKDTLVDLGPYVYDPNDLTDECWAFRTNPYVPGGAGTSTGANCQDFDFDRSNRSIYTSGVFAEALYASRVGRTMNMLDPHRRENTVARYDPSGALKWAVRVPGSVGSAGTLSGSNVVCSRTSGDVFFMPNNQQNFGFFSFTDGEQANISPFTDVALVRMDSLGRKVWIAHAKTDGRFNLTADAVDNLYWTSWTSYFDPSGDLDHYVSPAGDTTFFPFNNDNYRYIVKLDSDGNLLWWVKVEGSLNNQWIWEMETDPEGNMVLAGEIGGNLTFHSTNGSTFNLPFGSIVDGMLVKYSPDGVLLWGLSFDTAKMNGLAIDPHGNIYTSCWMDPGPSWSFAQNGGPAVVLTGAYPAVVSFTPDGLFRWSAGSNRIMSASTLGADEAGNVYLLGDVGTSIPGIVSITDATGTTVDMFWNQIARTQLIARWDSLGMNASLTSTEGDWADNALSADSDRFGDIKSCGALGTYIVMDVRPSLYTPDTMNIADSPIATYYHPAILAHYDDLFCSTGITLYLPEAEPAIGLTAYPNPASATVFLRSSAIIPVRLRVLDPGGRVLIDEPWRAGSERALDISKLAAGAYHVRVDHADGTAISTAIIVQ